MGERTSWAKLRQVVVATTDHSADVAATRAAFGLGECFVDPELDTMSLMDATFPVSEERYLEIVSPTDDETGVAKWLAKAGGRGGFVLSVQVPDTDGPRERAKERGVRLPADTIALGRSVLQLHPKDVGLVLELDGIAEKSEWFWDDINPGPEPGASISEIIGVEVAVEDPAAMTELWTYLLDIPEPTTPNELDLGGAWVRFVPGGPSADWKVLLRRADGATDVATPTLPGITYQLV